MKRAESLSARLLLLPLVPMFALGIVEVASRIHAPTPVASMDRAPDVTPEPDRCDACAMPA